MKKIYLGDGAYAELNEYNEVEITTEDGIRTTNKVVLDVWMMRILFKWFEGVTADVRQTQEPS